MIQIGKLRKDERKKLAVLHVDDMLANFSEEIEQAVNYSKIYTREVLFHDTDEKFEERWNTKVYVTDNDTVTELFAEPGSEKVAILNFASYKHPGGMYYEGSSAQEEFLCHHSILYPVLEAFQASYYAPHMKTLKRALYTDTGIYSSEVTFFDYDLIKNGQLKGYYKTSNARNADVITCAAPNVDAFMKYQRDRMNISNEEVGTLIHHVIYNRCEFVLEMARVNGATNLILGAFGCGVFGCDPTEVAKVFATLIYGKYKGVFKDIRFAVPKGPNNEAFFKNISKPLNIKVLEENHK